MKEEKLRKSYRLLLEMPIDCNQLTEDILDVTKIETQSLKLRIEQLDFNQIVSSAVSDFRKNNEARNNVEIKFENLVNEVSIRGDKGRLVQVITNLLGNALKFTKEGQITVTLTRDNNNQVVIIVKDSGTGIDPEIYPRLFSKFATKSEEGTGLGLYISKKIVEAHGGKIWAQNNPDGKGTTFYFTLPIQSPESLR